MDTPNGGTRCRPAGYSGPVPSRIGPQPSCLQVPAAGPGIVKTACGLRRIATDERYWH